MLPCSDVTSHRQPGIAGGPKTVKGAQSESLVDNTNIDCKSTGFNDITISHQFEVDKILVVDNIENSSEFSSSTRILKEVKLFCPDIKIEFSYSLSKGGIAIHATCREDRSIVERITS